MMPSAGLGYCFLMSLSVVFGFFFTPFTTFLSSTAVVFSSQPVPYLAINNPVVSFLFRTIQVVENAIHAAWAISIFSLFLASKWWIILVAPFDQLMQSSQVKLRAQTAQQLSTV